MSKTDEHVLSLREAATQLGCSKETVRRAIVSGELEAVSGWGQRGRELRVSSVGLLAWWQRHTGGVDGAVASTREVVEATRAGSEPAQAVASGVVEAQAEPLEVIESIDAEVAALSIESQEAYEPYAPYVVVGDEAVEVVAVEEPAEEEKVAPGPVGAVPFAVHSHALELALRAMERAQELEQQLSEERELRCRAERQATALDTELGQYRRALTESAESLAAERARAQAAELLCATFKGAEAEASQRGWGSRLRNWLLGGKPG